MNASLGHQLRSNRGFFSRAEALDCGETDRTLGAAHRAGLIVRLRRGMYTHADIYQASDDAGKHLLHARAAVAAQRGAVALTGPSAAALHGFALYEEDLTVVHLLRLDRGCSHRAAKINHHVVTQDIEDDLGVYDGVTAISPARAVWEVACRSSLESGVVTADSALRKDPRLSDAIEELQQRFAYFPGSRRGRLAIKLSDARADSPGESVTRVQFHRYGIPMPELQYHVVDHHRSLVGISDFYWEQQRHLGEFDGKIKYQRFLRPDETASECVFREKKREDAMRADLRGMTRFTWSEVMPHRAGRTMADLAQALDQSYRLYVRGRTIIAG
ncbi:MAG TPA: type IV toxin-antitoxin system AbiEi family antitoxin domain-containing protein [Propionibacteriaceae bacterium]|nr:type IV toxin-antitoxin system AbiEi family antitoxin domain-containing protein [Propionibacteriaceae bacterium]